MIQRFQTLFMSFSIISLVVIIVNFPILINNADKYYIENFPLIKYIMLASVFLTTYSIFQYKKLKKNIVKVIINLKNNQFGIWLELIKNLSCYNAISRPKFNYDFRTREINCVYNFTCQKTRTGKYSPRRS